MNELIGSAVAGIAAGAVLTAVWFCVGPGPSSSYPVRLRTFAAWSAVWYAAYSALRIVIPDGNRQVAIRHAADVQFLSGGRHFAVLLVEVLHPAAGFLAAYYSTAHLWVTAAVLVWLARRHPDVWRRQAPVLLIASSIALVLFAVYPVAPPRTLGIGSFHLTAVESAGALPYAALPSLHLTWALWCDLTLWPLVRRLRPLLGAHTALTVLAVTGTGNHWLLDLAAGGLLLVATRHVVNRAGGARGPALRAGKGTVHDPPPTTLRPATLPLESERAPRLGDPLGRPFWIGAQGLGRNRTPKA